MLSIVLYKVGHNVIRYTLAMVFLFVCGILCASLITSLGFISNALLVENLSIFIIGLLIIRLGGLLLFKTVFKKLGIELPRILEEIVFLLAYVVWLLIRLSDIGFDPASLLASTAVLTAAVAFAMQDTLGNVLSGLALQTDQSVRIGDWLEIDDIKGEVIQVQWRSTVLQTILGERILIPNSYLMKTQVRIVGGQTVKAKRYPVYFYTGFELSPSLVITTVEHSLKNVNWPGVDSKAGSVCQVLDFNNGLVTYAVYIWLTDPKRLGYNQSLVRQHLYALFVRNDWKMASPSMELNHSRQPQNQGKNLLDKHKVNNKLEFLKKINLFAPLSQDELLNLAQSLKTLPYIAGNVVVEQGDSGDSMYIVCNGFASVWLETNNVINMVAKLNKYDIFGEMSLMTGQPRTATIRASSNLVCYQLDKDNFKNILKTRPELADMFAETLTMRSQELENISHNTNQNEIGEKKRAVARSIYKWFGI